MPRRHPRDPGPSAALGRRLAESRRAAGLIQRELASALRVSPRSVQAWERGEASPYGRIADLEALLGCPREWLLYGRHAEPHPVPQGAQTPGATPDERQLLLGIDHRLDLLEQRMNQLSERVTDLEGTVT